MVKRNESNEGIILPKLNSSTYIYIYIYFNALNNYRNFASNFLEILYRN